MEQYALLEATELWDALISIDDPRRCIFRVMYSFHSDWSPLLFDDAKVRYVAEQGQALAANFDGETENGINSVFAYLSIAGLQATFYPNDVAFTNSTWSAIKDICHDLAANTAAYADTPVSYYTLAHMFFAASFDNINSDASVVALSDHLLDELANSSFLNSNMESLYPYYYCYYYLLDLYHRYPQDNPAFITAIATHTGSITTLGECAINKDLNVDNHPYFDEISLLTVRGLARYAPHPELQAELEPALQGVTDAYEDSDARWTTAALALVQNDMSFELTEEELLSSIRSNVLPCTYEFLDGRMAIHTSLEYDEVLDLYQASQEVESQFFRLLGNRDPVDQGNDTVQIVIYGNQQDYQSFNHILYGIDYPNSGGVYIESQSTIYTFDRTILESSYTLEELFRHEYAHYLQGKYLIPGSWGQSPTYDNSRLVWFEEGMAQLLAASTRTDGIKSLNVIRNRINSNSSYEDLSTVLTAGYGSGNSNAYYIYGAMFWSKLYKENRNRLIELFYYIREGNLTQFDNLVNQFASSPYEEFCFHNHIDSSLADDNFWISPSTDGPHVYNLDTTSLLTLFQSIGNLGYISTDSMKLSVLDQPRRFEIRGNMTLNAPSFELGYLAEEASKQLDQILKDLNQSLYNNFDYTTAYFENLRPDQTPGSYLATYVISGPINDECIPMDIDDVSIETLASQTLITPPPSYLDVSALRYRPLGSDQWTELDGSAPFSITGLDGHQPYVYELSYECSAGVFAPYSERSSFNFCPLNITYSDQVSADVSLQADHNAYLSSILDSSGDLYVSTGSGTFLQGDFTVYKGSTLEVNLGGCNE